MGPCEDVAVISTPECEPVAAPWRAVALDQFVPDVLARLGSPTGRPAVLAVDGRSASGKSTLASRLASAIPASAIVHSDDVAWWESFFGWDRLLVSGVLEPALTGDAVAFRPPAWQERGRTGAIEVPAGASVLILEGVGVSRRVLQPYLDAAIWVQCDQPEARRRGLIRDLAAGDTEEFWDQWQAEELTFLAADRPWDRAGCIVCGTPELAGVDYEPGTDVVLGTRPA